jgi:ABC-type sugar transport system ATPase subunit
VREQAAAGVTVVVSSHMLGELRQMADEVLVLRTGQMVAHLDDAGHALGGNENALEDFYFSLLS